MIQAVLGLGSAVCLRRVFGCQEVSGQNLNPKACLQFAWLLLMVSVPRLSSFLPFQRTGYTSPSLQSSPHRACQPSAESLESASRLSLCCDTSGESRYG